MVTLTRVKLSSDLSFATIFWSCLGDEGARSKAAHALSSAASHVQREIAEVFHTRRSPRVKFEFDASIAGAIHVGKLLDELREEREAHETAADAEADDVDATAAAGGEEE
jgi:ribosome-binding factor A